MANKLIPLPETQISDGRLLRSARSRARIVDALFELVEQGELLPTGEQVAEVAGVALRTVFRHFEDMSSLYAEVQARVESEVRELMLGQRVEGDIYERIDLLVEARCRTFERVAPFKRAQRLHRARSPHATRSHLKMQEGLRLHLRFYVPEVGRLPDHLATAAEVLTSFEGWEQLHDDRKLNRKATALVMASGLRVLLGLEEDR